jgi:acyl carrier protein
MTEDDARQIVLKVLGDIAPEAELDTIEPQTSFRDQFDIDSVDFLNFVIALHEATNVEIPEADYPKLQSLDGAAAYLVAHAGS